MRLRPYQLEAVTGTIEALNESRSALGVAATGLGKTVIIGEVIRRRPRGRKLVIAHRGELVRQLETTIRRMTNMRVGVDMNVERAFMADDVVVATVQTMNAGRMAAYPADHFADIIIDEAHHSVASSYAAVIQRFPNASVFGVTATPDRSDELALGRVYDRVAFDYDIDFGVGQSWLVPVASRRIPTPRLDFSGVRTTAGDLNGGDLAKLMLEEDHLHSVATPTVEQTGDKRTLVFAASVNHADRLCEIINRHKPGTCAWVSGETPAGERAAILDAFRGGRLQYLVNVGVLTEGFDDPGIEYVVMARPTKSRALYAQMLGRGTRPLPEASIDDHHDSVDSRRQAIADSPKPRVTIIDFIGNVGRHSLVTALDILAGDYDKEIVASVTRKAESQDVDISAALAEELAERQRIALMAAMRERERRLGVVARAEYDVIDVDPFVVLDVPPIRSRAWDRGHRAKGGIVDRLRQEGVFQPEALGEAGAKRLMTRLVSDKMKGRPTYKQKAALKYLGVSEIPATAQQAAELLRSLQVKP